MSLPHVITTQDNHILVHVVWCGVVCKLGMTFIITSQYYGIQKIGRCQKTILQYNYTTGILLSTSSDMFDLHLSMLSGSYM